VGFIVFNAFSTLQKKLKAKNHGYTNVKIEIPENYTVLKLIKDLNLEPEDVEAVFLNGKVVPFNSSLQDGDRVALTPPGTPGPYRVFLGMKNKNSKLGN
jgi:sulfur carrier protein ThiS